MDHGNEDIYIAGIVDVTITNVLGGELRVALFQENNKDFLLGHDGKIVYLKKQWPFEKGANHIYSFNGTLDWPVGSCELQISSAGNVILQFDSADCISVKEYCQTPSKFAYRGDSKGYKS